MAEEIQTVDPESSNIKRYSHIGGVFTIEFKNGTKGTHEGVPLQMFTDMRNSESAGKFYHANIKGKFPWAKVEPERHDEA